MRWEQNHGRKDGVSTGAVGGVKRRIDLDLSLVGNRSNTPDRMIERKNLPKWLRAKQ